MVKYYNKQEVMAYLKISLPTLNRYMKKGLKYEKVGKNVRFKMRDINKFKKDKIKHYLTYEDLETLENDKYYKVKMNNHEYDLTINNQDNGIINVCLMLDEYKVMCNCLEDFYADKQFFNDLRLELAEEYGND